MQLAPVTAKLGRLLAALDSSLVERGTHVRVALLALLSGHHALLLGPPGTAKSLLARALCRCIQGASLFEYLLSKFTHPDELFGPVSIPGLKEEDYRRLTTGYLPAAHIAFLDEIFKANSAILNSLLTLINERVFHHGKHRDAVPLLGLVGASNETPAADGGLTALYDRFLVRLVVPPIVDDGAFLQVCLGGVPAFDPPDADRLTVAEIQQLRRLVAEIDVDEPTRQALLRIRGALKDAEIDASDRRWRWALDLLRMSALTSGRRSLSLLDLSLLEHCFGDAEGSEAVVRKCVRDALVGSTRDALYLDPLRTSWKDLKQQKVYVAFDRWRPEVLGRPEEFASACDKAASCLDQQLEQIQHETAATPWITEAPAELAAGLLATRMRIQQHRAFADKVRADLAAYSPATLVAEYLKNRRSHYYHHSHYTSLWVCRAGVKDEWTALDPDGSMHVAQAPPDGKPRLELDDATGHALMFEPDIPGLARKLADAALKPIVSAPTNLSLAQQAQHHQNLLNNCTVALRNLATNLRQQGLVPPYLPELPDFAATADKKQGKARAA